MTRRGVLVDEAVDVVEALPELHDALPLERRVAARRTLRARIMVLRRGRWDALHDAELVEDGAGFLILEGALIRCVTAAHRTSGELLGPGDVLRPCHDPFLEDPQFTNYYRAISDARLAVLDGRVTRAAALVPELVPALVNCMTRRSGGLARQLVIVQSQSVETRILVTLNYLAERWGVMTTEGVVLPEFLSHGTLALLLGARRPSVTSAMVRLTSRGEVERREDGRWLIGRPVESLVA
jgi:CRP/FNR family transcriptional regulator, cyclic AMP receptor protein